MLLGTISLIDADGDALIDFGLPDGDAWVFKPHFWHFAPGPTGADALRGVARVVGHTGALAALRAGGTLAASCRKVTPHP